MTGGGRPLSRRRFGRGLVAGLGVGLCPGPALAQGSGRADPAPVRDVATPADGTRMGRGERRRVRVLALGGMWPAAVVDRLADELGVYLDIEPLASAEEMRTRLRRTTLSGPVSPPGRAEVADLVGAGLEDVAGWRAEGLLQPLTSGSGRQDGWLAREMRAHGAMDPDGRTWMVPMTMGCDVAFADATALAAMGPAATEAGTAAGDRPEVAPRPWSALLSPALDGALMMAPGAAVWMAVRLADPSGARLHRALHDVDDAKALFAEVDDSLDRWRERTAVVCTDTVTALKALAGAGRAGLLWDGVLRRVVPDGGAHWIPAEGTRAWVDGLVCPTGAHAPEAARACLERLAQPDIQAVWAIQHGALPARSAARALMPEPDRAWIARVFERSGAVARLWVPPMVTGPAASAFADSLERYEYG